MVVYELPESRIMIKTQDIIFNLINKEIDISQAIHQLDVLLDNSIDIPDRILANNWKHELMNEYNTMSDIEKLYLHDYIPY